MKTLIASALIASAAFAGSAQAMTDHVSSGVKAQIHRYAPDADLSQLTWAEAHSLLSIIHGGESSSDVRAQVRAELQ